MPGTVLSSYTEVKKVIFLHEAYILKGEIRKEEEKEKITLAADKNSEGSLSKCALQPNRFHPTILQFPVEVSNRVLETDGCVLESSQNLSYHVGVLQWNTIINFGLAG